MNAAELKIKARAILTEIEEALEQDSEWNSPLGNGCNASECIDCARVFVKLIEQLT